MSDQVPFPIGYVWQQYTHSEAKAPTQKKIEGVPESDHGTYETHPYYIFVESKATGKKMLFSDTGLRAELTYIPDTAKKYKPGLGAKFKMKFEHPPEARKFENAVLSYNDDTCDELSFIVTGTGNFADLPSGPHPYKHYVLSKPRPANEGNDQTLGSVFVKKPFAFDLLLRSWDVTRMDLELNNFQITGNDKKLFAIPDLGSKDYDQPGGDVVVPYGWLYAVNSQGGGEESSSMLSSAEDVMNSVQKAAGFNFSASVGGGVEGIVEASAEYSLANNKSVLDKIQNMREKEKTYTEHKYVETECVFVLDRRTVRFNDFLDDRHSEKGGFVNAIRELRNSFSGGTLSDEGLADFIGVWGTHYAYAATFGARGRSVETFEKETLQKLIAKEVDVKQAWSAGVAVKVFSFKSDFKYKNDSEEAQNKMKELKSIKQDAFNSFKCVGGGTCDGGKPGTGDRIPIFLDLRPISDLLGPPFFTDEETVTTLRDRLAAAIRKYAFTKSATTVAPLSVSEIKFGAFRINVGPYVQSLGDVEIIGPHVTLPAGSLIDKRGPISLDDDDTSAGSFAAAREGGTSATFFHRQEPIEIGIDLRAATVKSETTSRIAAPVWGGGWFGANRISIKVDPSKDGTIEMGPFVCKTVDERVPAGFSGEPYSDVVALELRFDVTVTRRDLKKLIGLNSE